MFNLWNPIATDEGCELDVTMANVLAFNQGSEEIVRAFVDAWGFSGTIDGWTVEPIRTSYFSDYLDSDDWRSRWQRAWNLRVRGRLAAPTKNASLEISKFVSATDPTVDLRAKPVEGEEDRCRALIAIAARQSREVLDTETIPKLTAALAAAGFGPDRVQVKVRQVAVGREMSSQGFRDSLATFSAAVATPMLAKLDRARLPLLQVRVLISDVEFPKQEPLLTKLCAEFEASGCILHRHPVEIDAVDPMSWRPPA